MYKIVSANNSIEPLQLKSFTELGFKERKHLQEWIAKCPSCLGEELLILQKEFDGFAETSERLDLLALDKQGSLVLIENKLDDTGRDVTWQALKYASYCSGMSKHDVRSIFQEYLDDAQPGADAGELIAEFLDEDDFDDVVLNSGFTQRILLIAANFRREVTSTVLWLLNFRVRLQCFVVAPYSMGDQTFLKIDQIIPTKAAEEFMISLADKAMDEVQGAASEKVRQKVLRELWATVFSRIGEKTPLFQNVSPSTGVRGWIGAGAGTAGAAFNFVAGKKVARVELYIDRGEREQNKAIFDSLAAQRAEIEQKFGGPLIWERLDKKKASRVKTEIPANIYVDDWERPVEFMVDAMARMEHALKGPLAAAARKIA